MTEDLKESKAVILTDANTFEVGVLPIPEVGKHQVLVKVMAAPINPSDMLLINGLYPTPKKYPFGIGIQGCGRVIKSGTDKIAQDLIGKKVAFYNTNQPFSTYSQYAVVPAFECIQLDESISFQHGAMTCINPITVYGMLEQVKEGNHKTIVHTAGASQLGRMMTRYFSKHGIDVISIVRKQEQIEMLKKEQAAKYVLNSSDANFDKQFAELTAKLGTKWCYDAVGGTNTSRILQAMPAGSTISVYGLLAGDSYVRDITIKDLLFLSKSVRGFHLALWRNKKTPQQYHKAAKEIGALMKDSLQSNIVKQVDLEHLREGIDFYQANMSTGKVIVKPWGNKQ